MVMDGSIQPKFIPLKIGKNHQSATNSIVVSAKCDRVQVPVLFFKSVASVAIIPQKNALFAKESAM
jgi:hypothetical protein